MSPIVADEGRRDLFEAPDGWTEDVDWALARDKEAGGGGKESEAGGREAESVSGPKGVTVYAPMLRDAGGGSERLAGGAGGGAGAEAEAGPP